MAEANDRQVGGEHYRKGHAELQHWDVVVMFNMDYFQAQVTRYLFRWKDKGGLEDLLKAQHYLQKYIEVHEHYETKKDEPSIMDIASRMHIASVCAECGHSWLEHDDTIGCTIVIEEVTGPITCPCNQGRNPPEDYVPPETCDVCHHSWHSDTRCKAADCVCDGPEHD